MIHGQSSSDSHNTSIRNVAMIPPINIQMCVALAQFCIETVVESPKAQIKSMMIPTNGILVISSVLTQSVRETGLSSNSVLKSIVVWLYT